MGSQIQIFGRSSDSRRMMKGLLKVFLTKSENLEPVRRSWRRKTKSTGKALTLRLVKSETWTSTLDLWAKHPFLNSKLHQLNRVKVNQRNLKEPLRETSNISTLSMSKSKSMTIRKNLILIKSLQHLLNKPKVPQKKRKSSSVAGLKLLVRKSSTLTSKSTLIRRTSLVRNYLRRTLSKRSKKLRSCMRKSRLSEIRDISIGLQNP